MNSIAIVFFLSFLLKILGINGCFNCETRRSIDSYSFYNCSGDDGALKLSASLFTIWNKSFSFPNFSQNYFKGIKEPSCKGDIVFKENQIQFGSSY